MAACPGSSWRWRSGCTSGGGGLRSVDDLNGPVFCLYIFTCLPFLIAVTNHVVLPRKWCVPFEFFLLLLGRSLLYWPHVFSTVRCNKCLCQRGTHAVSTFERLVGKLSKGKPSGIGRYALGTILASYSCYSPTEHSYMALMVAYVILVSSPPNQRLCIDNATGH